MKDSLIVKNYRRLHRLVMTCGVFKFFLYAQVLYLQINTSAIQGRFPYLGNTIYYNEL